MGVSLWFDRKKLPGVRGVPEGLSRGSAECSADACRSARRTGGDETPGAGRTAGSGDGDGGKSVARTGSGKGTIWVLSASAEIGGIIAADGEEASGCIGDASRSVECDPAGDKSLRR